MSVIGGSSVAPIAIPTMGVPRTTETAWPLGVTARTSTLQGSWPDSTAARAAVSAARTSPNETWAAAGVVNSKLIEPPRSGCHPIAARLRSHRGGIRRCRQPSTRTSTPSTMRPASRPGTRWRILSSSRSVTPEPVLISFALRGAPCGYRPDSTSWEGAGNEQDPVLRRHADDAKAPLMGRVIVIVAHPPVLIVRHSGGFWESNAVLAQVGCRLHRVPRVVHARDRRERRSRGAYASLTPPLTAEVSQRAFRIGCG